MILRFVGARRLDFVPTPEEAPSGRLPLVSELIGISAGTELLLWRGEVPEGYHNPNELTDLRCSLAYPIAFGYMNVGRLADGERVFAYAPHADRCWVDPAQTVPLGDLPADDAVFLANTETALHLLQTARPLPGQRIGVWGLGIVGLLLCGLLRRSGVGTVWGIDPLPLRRQAAAELGAHALDPTEARQALPHATSGLGLELAFELSGRPDTLNDIFPQMAEEGRVIVGSWYGRRRAPLELGHHFLRRRLSLVASQVSVPLRDLGPTWDVARRRHTALELIRELRPGRWISHRFPLVEADRAFTLLDSAPENCLQVVLMP